MFSTYTSGRERTALTSDGPLTLSVVVPATNDPPTLEVCLDAIRSAADQPEELIVVARAPEPGPAAARNEGARKATGDVLVFVDADVEVHRDVFDRIRRVFADDAELAAVFGSYDDEPAADGLVSEFRNLLHHHVHQQSGGPAGTFWAGLGAIRRDVFLRAGSFDERRFQHPSVEDIDLGMRITDAGERILLEPLIQGKHLKRWTLAEMVATDLFRRGIPWAQLLIERRSAGTALNLGWRHRASAVASLVLVTSVIARRRRAAGASLLALVALNTSFYALLLRRGGWRQLAAGVPLHVLHHLVGVAAVPPAAADLLRQRGHD
jgi:GT2 family glycosyltransferase